MLFVRSGPVACAGNDAITDAECTAVGWRADRRPVFIAVDHAPFGGRGRKGSTPANALDATQGFAGIGGRTASPAGRVYGVWVWMRIFVLSTRVGLLSSSGPFRRHVCSPFAPPCSPIVRRHGGVICEYRHAA